MIFFNNYCLHCSHPVLKQTQSINPCWKTLFRKKANHQLIMNEFSTNMNSKTTAKINEHDWLTAWLKSQNLLYCDLPTGSQSIRKLNKFLCRIRETISLLWKRNKKTNENFCHILACRLRFSLPLQPWQKKHEKKDDYTLEEFEGWKNLLEFLGCRESKGGYYNLFRKK